MTQTLTIQERLTWKDDSVDPADDMPLPPIKFDFALDEGATYAEDSGVLELDSTGQSPSGGDIVTPQLLWVRSLRGTVYVDLRTLEGTPTTYKTIMHVREGEAYPIRLADAPHKLSILFKAPSGETARVRYWMIGKTT